MDSEERKVLVDDAEANYQSGRINDAYKGFSYLKDQAINDRDAPNFLYFYYRMLIIDEDDENPLKFVRTLREISQDCLQESARFCSEVINVENDSTIKVKIMEEMKDILPLVGEYQNLKKLESMLMETYNLLSREYDIALDKKIEYLEKLILLMKGNDDELFKKSEHLLAEAYEELAADNQEKGELDNIATYLQKALSFFENCQDIEKILQIEKKLQTLN